MIATLTWRDTNGDDTDLTADNGFLITKGPVGLDAPPVALTVDDFAAFDGGVLVRRRRPARAIALPMHLTHPTRVATRVAQLASLLADTGELHYSDGTHTRTLRDVTYEAGLSGDLSNAHSPLTRDIVLSLLALDPWWYGEEEYKAFNIAAGTAFSAAISFNAAIPFSGGSGTAVVVEGDTDAYPVFTIIGPATTLTITLGTGSLSLAGELADGSELVIDSRPGSRGPRLNGGDVDWSLLTAESRLFTLPVGLQSITVGGTTGTTGDTSVALTFEPRWLTP